MVGGGAKRHTWLRGLAKAFEMLEDSQAHTHTEAANDVNNIVEAGFFFSLFCTCFVVLLESASELNIMESAKKQIKCNSRAYLV